MFNERIKGHPNAKLNPPKMASLDELISHLNAHESTEPGVIYIHVPFCDHICSFCAMNRSQLGSELDEYLQQLLVQIHLFSSTKYFASKPISSVYFGGGTPSVFKSSHWQTLLSALKNSFNITSDAQICSESTLHNLPNEKLKTMIDGGINRLSIGIQSFNSAARKFFNRTGDGEYAKTHIKRLRENFAGTLCIDIIYNYPDQEIQSALEDARLCDELGIDSVSFYSLMHFEGSKLGKSLSALPYDMNKDFALHESFLQQMKQQGFSVLEHTKLVKNDEYRYIRMSHAGADILPLGIGAGGSVAGFGMYAPKKGVQLITHKSPLEAEFARFYNLFQYSKVDLNAAFSKLSILESAVMEFLRSCEDAGYVSIKANQMSYTDKGIFFGNNIASKIIEISKPILLKENLCK